MSWTTAPIQRVCAIVAPCCAWQIATSASLQRGNALVSRRARNCGRGEKSDDFACDLAQLNNRIQELAQIVPRSRSRTVSHAGISARAICSSLLRLVADAGAQNGVRICESGAAEYAWVEE